jgi:hypothetical protein
MQVTKKCEDQHPAAGLGLSGALGSLRKGGVKEQGRSEGLLEALHADMGTGIGKTNAVGLRGGAGRVVPVADCIAATGACGMVGCDGWGGGGEKVWGLMMIGGAEKEK